MFCQNCIILRLNRIILAKYGLLTLIFVPLRASSVNLNIFVQVEHSSTRAGDDLFTCTYLTLRLSGWTRESNRLLKIFWEGTLYLNRLHDFSLLSSNAFLHPFLRFAKKIPWHQKISFPKADF